MNPTIRNANPRKGLLFIVCVMKVADDMLATTRMRRKRNQIIDYMLVTVSYKKILQIFVVIAVRIHGLAGCILVFNRSESDLL